jgi:predicted nucleotidyltransferase
MPSFTICYHLRMGHPVTPAVVDAIRAAARRTAGLELLMLFGSRARGDARSASDWDFGYLGTPEADITALLAALVELTGSDRVDLADLGRASGVLRFRAARDGQLLHEGRPGLGDEFRLQAAGFWCDMAPILGPGLEEVLARLDP